MIFVDWMVIVVVVEGSSLSPTNTAWSCHGAVASRDLEVLIVLLLLLLLLLIQ